MHEPERNRCWREVDCRGGRRFGVLNDVRLEAALLGTYTLVHPLERLFSVAVVDGFKVRLVLQTVHNSSVCVVDPVHSATSDIVARDDKVTELWIDFRSLNDLLELQIWQAPRASSLAPVPHQDLILKALRVRARDILFGDSGLTIRLSDLTFATSDTDT